ncbi:MAG: phosphate signaling complex PhoU family protein [Promethearchaeia archaeon]
MRSQLEFYLDEIAGKLERMEELGSRALMKAMDAFGELDTEIAEDAKTMADDIDELAQKVEENVFETIARRQPVASDLRKLSTYLLVSHHLHRVGRYAHKIGRIVYLVKDSEHYKEMESLPYMAKLAKDCLSISMKAILEEDLSGIHQLEELEAKSDKETEEMFTEIVGFLRERTDIIQMSMMYIIVGRYFERAADQAFSIAERAVYMVKGERVKLGLAYKEEPMEQPH